MKGVEGMKAEDLSFRVIREAQMKSNETCNTIGEWKEFWRKFADANEMTHDEALKVAQDRL